jgi:hypothetical protein
MKKKRSLKKILIIGVLAGFIFAGVGLSGFFVKYTPYFFSNIFLSLTITPSSVIPDEDPDPDPEPAGGGNGFVIFHLKPPVQIDKPDEINPLNPELDVIIPPEENIPEDANRDQIFSEFVDEVNGIGLAKKFKDDEAKVVTDVIISVPVLPAIGIGEVIIPDSPSADFDIQDTSARLYFYGIAEPYSYILLEISSQPNVITLFTDKDGKWFYDLPEALPAGLHHAYIWEFSQTEKVKTLISSKGFLVKESGPKDSAKRTKISMDTGSFKATIANSALITSLKKDSTGEQMFYVNGRVLNDDAKLTKKEKLTFIVFTKPLFNEFKNIESAALKFTYKIYDDKDLLIDTIPDNDSIDYMRQLKSGTLSFTKSFSFFPSGKMVIGKYKLMVEVNSAGFNYWLPLSFEITQENSGNFFDKYGTVLMISSLLIVVIIGGGCTGLFVFHLKNKKRR